MNTIHSKRAFTLTELLVVIAIIGVLTGIMIPVVTTVRRSIGITKCQSNLRQVYLGVSLFANDRQGWLPGGSGKPLTTIIPPWHDASGPSNALGVYIYPYIGIVLGSGNAFADPYMRCPAGPELPTDSTANNKRSYLLASGPGGVFPMGNPDANTMPVKMRAYTNQYPAPVLPMIMDTDVEYLPQLASANMIFPTPVHVKGRNVVFFDGSVRLLTQQELNENYVLLNKLKTN